MDREKLTRRSGRINMDMSCGSYNVSLTKLNRILLSMSMTSTNVWIIFWKEIFTGAEGWQSAVQWRPRMT